MSLDVSTGLAGRTLFMTGGTGFLGKVLLYKILADVPDIKMVYLLCRAKKQRRSDTVLQPHDRVQQQVLGSPCFDPLRKKYGKEKWAEMCKKVKALNGDITEDKLGLNAGDLETVLNEVQLIVHLAATVNFNEPLNSAVQMNTLGGLRVLAIAKGCKNLESMVHVSTCYVNYQRQGRDNPNLEQIYPLPFDPENMVKHILTMHKNEIPQESKRLLKEHGFPNTYTFTKTMGEQLIQRYKENVPVVIVRPSIVGAALRDPFPGWVDALTAAGGIILTSCLGVIRELNINMNLLADVVPVDFVVNVIIKALFKQQQYRLGNAAGTESSRKEEIKFIYQVATTSTLNAVTWARIGIAVKDIMDTPHKHPKALSRPDVYLTENPTLYRIRYVCFRYLPYLALRCASMLPEPIGTQEFKKMVTQLGRAIRRADMMNTEFHEFVVREWVYDTTNAEKLDEGLNEKSRNAFPFNPLDMDWYLYIQHYVYGLLKFIVKDVGELVEPSPPRSAVKIFQLASSL